MHAIRCTPSDARHPMHAIGNPARRALLHAGYARMEELSGVSEAKILALHGVGPKAVRILKERMGRRGWRLPRPRP